MKPELLKETFEEYKKTILKALSRSSLLCSGSIIQSTDHIFEEFRDMPHVSPDFINKCLIEVYKKTIELFFTKKYSNYNIDSEKIGRLNVSLYSQQYGITPKFAFATLRSYRGVGIDVYTDDNRYLPNYYYSLIGSTVDCTFFMAPMSGYYGMPIEEDDTYNFYMIDSPVQDILSIIKNMNYEIFPCEDGWNHVMEYPIYDCQYQAICLQARNIQLYRDRVLKGLLS